MTKDQETGTLAELNVKPGDVFELANLMLAPCTLQSDGRILIGDGPEYYGRYPKKGHLMAHIVSRASATLKIWGEMTDEEKGALLLAHHEGKAIESSASGAWTLCEPKWKPDAAYRVRPPEPKRTTQTFIGSARHGFSHLWERPEDTHSLTLPLIDGKLPAGQYRNAEGDVITVEELK